MASKPLIIIAFLTLFVGLSAACTDDENGNADNANTVDMGADSGDAATGDDTGDAGPSVMDRKFVEVPPLNGLPAENQVLSPEFQPLQNFAVDSRLQTQLLRQVYSETPYSAACLRLVAEGSDMELLLWGVLRDGTNVASVWIGGDGEAIAADVAVEMHGITIGDLSEPPAPVELVATNDLVQGDTRTWQRFETTVEVPRGTFVLRITGGGSQDILAHAPIVLNDMAAPRR